ncbi:hypothetical protein [Pseudomonas syringae group genomosp. 3]|uniref:hypothetical protein n=1 Tax=Pseudomonas syringae group genomosp. 3 TaxID=251701 RepID=UPI0006B9CD66|nr:hypothetical protein [Pseudomonas syringae group genomosp. 3]KPB94807.1 Uncharacterized protein AC503_0743 [Pseudomonas syringae pv. maculicola]
MQNTASSLAAELKRQILSQLPARPLMGGGFHHFTIKALISPNVSGDTTLDVHEILLRELADECPEWKIEIVGDLNDLKATFSR